MFNHYFGSIPCIAVKTVSAIAVPVTFVTERLELDGDNFVLHSGEGNLPMVDPDLQFIAVTPLERAKVGKISPSASNFLAPSLEFQQKVAATLAALDDKFSYDAALAKISEQSAKLNATKESNVESKTTE